MVALGPGVLKIGTAEAEIDYSCLVNSMSLNTDVSVGDSSFKLCGTEVPGTITPTGTLEGNVDQDIDAATDGLFEFCSKNWGTVQSFIFEPSTSAGLEARGSLLVVPLSFGGDEYGAPMASDVSFNTVGDVTFYRGAEVAWVQTMSPKQGTAAPAAAAAAAPVPVGAGAGSDEF